MSLYRIMKAAYKRVLPKSARNTIYVISPTFLKRFRARLIRVLEKSAHHDEIYDQEYFTTLVDNYMAKSCDAIAESNMDAFSPKSVVDVGCGTGLLLLALQKRGVSCLGLEYSEAALNICRQRGVEVIRFDLEHDTLPRHLRGDIAISTEVAEHLPESCADRFVKILCKIADNIVMTAAKPQASYAGTDHVNEQPHKYWIAKFEARCFTYNKELTSQWRENWQTRNVSKCYVEGLMVFGKKGTSVPTHREGRV